MCCRYLHCSYSTGRHELTMKHVGVHVGIIKGFSSPSQRRQKSDKLCDWFCFRIISPNEKVNTFRHEDFTKEKKYKNGKKMLR